MLRFTLTIIAALSAAALTGCLATLDGYIDNNLACTVAKDKLFMVSEWGPLSIGSKIRKADTEAVCNPKPAPTAPAAAAPAPAASAAK